MAEKSIAFSTQPVSWAEWPGYNFIFFDCDSTLSAIEGIDELARQRGKFEEVKRMTDAAMEGEIHLQNVYDRRLQLLSPTRAEIRSLMHHYRRTVVPDTREVIEALKFAGKELFIVSGGLLAAVQPFGEWLGIPGQNIRAVEIRYNKLSGQWWDYMQDHWGPRPDEEYLDPKQSPLIQSQGKADVIDDILSQGERYGRAVLIGDGVSDLAARPAVEAVIGFGGVVERRRVAAEADIFVKSNSLAPIVPLALNLAGQEQLKASPYRPLLEKGLALIEANEVIFQPAVSGVTRGL